MAHAMDLERMARELSQRSQRLRQTIVATKRALADAKEDITESVQEMQTCRDRMRWLETMLANLREAIALSKTASEKEGFEDELEEWEDEQDEEVEHMQFLTREHNQLLAHRKVLVSTLLSAGRQFIQVRQRERLLVAAALRLGVVRLNRIKQVV